MFLVPGAYGGTYSKGSGEVWRMRRKERTCFRRLLFLAILTFGESNGNDENMHHKTIPQTVHLTHITSIYHIAQKLIPNGLKI